MNDLISVVVPVYNVEKYLKKSIESIINQTYKNLEIIIIDDGSSDDSYNVCKKYKEIDSRIILIHTENKGVSHARNLGLSKANGKYLIFIDSDDYIEDNMIEILYTNLKKTKSDLSICMYEIVKGDDEGNFNPTSDIKRSEMVALICRMKGEESIATSTGSKFDDVAENHWANGYINWGVDNGIIKGYGDGNFGPDASVTYQDALVMILMILFPTTTIPLSD